MASTLSSTNTDFENFGHKVYLNVSQNNKNQNVFLSPASIALAMAMCAAGAQNETLKQMLHVFDASSTDQLEETAKQIMRIFSIVDNDTQVKLKLANRLYGQKAYKLRESYLTCVQNSFKADIKLEDFENNSAGVVNTINEWVEEQTNALIKNLLSPNDVTPDTRLIIVNCIYFKGTWVKPFKEHLTDQNADFHAANGEMSKVKLMHQNKTFGYAQNDDLHVQIAHLPYKSDKHGVQFVFTVILPNRGTSLDEVEKKLASDPNLMRQILSAEITTRKELLLYLPKFKMEAKFELNDILIKLGMTDAFDTSKADFTEMVSKQDDPSAFIDVNELGKFRYFLEYFIDKN
ncbi:unnamed protein product [Rotaria sp. Silwood2]|nr:unnamed protein product [Rotaria sp. Silwood2]CAF4224507.1 unnamed protein product [Rotaria sp. Silwood2]CAF4600507.1 unnamed protein product [Rotaria sp. Silwood2]